MTTIAEKLESDLVTQARQRFAAGQPLTTRQSDALRRAERLDDERGRFTAYWEVPAALWLEASGFTRAELRDFADETGLPLDGTTIDLNEFLPKLHDLLDKRSRSRRRRGGGPKLNP